MFYYDEKNECIQWKYFQNFQHKNKRIAYFRLMSLVEIKIKVIFIKESQVSNGVF